MTAAPDELLGRTVAGYTIEAGLGSGANADIYLATHPDIDEKVALKVLSTRLRLDPEAQDRLVCEGELQASLDHPGILRVYEQGRSDGLHYLVMTYAERGDLMRLLEREAPLSIARTLSIVGQLADVLDAIHAVGIAHLDMKLSNVLVGSGERIYLADFGRARRIDESVATAGGQSRDIVNLAAAAYRCLLGVPATELEALKENRAGMRSVAQERADVPVAVDDVLAGVTTRPPAYRTAGAFARSLRIAAPSAPEDEASTRGGP